MNKAAIKRAIWMLQAIWLASKGAQSGYCTACGKSVPAFLPYRSGASALSPILRDLNLNGSNLNRFRCPRCGSSDRERHLLAFIERADSIQFHDSRVLHFAPEQAIKELILKNAPHEYVQADLFPAHPDVIKIDITRMPFESAHFDLVIANHVLEHVDNDSAALNEIFRVLRNGGHAILQTPYATRLPTTIEAEQVRSPDARLALYGQEDHIRLYGTDLFSRIERHGFIPRLRSHDDVLRDMGPDYHGVNANEPFMHFVKPD
ncbi:MAG: methyltransferase domain-containing protein [Xanthomonadales bacterium PRO7]|nr:methyltransferase domain-containing protein [Xanthomonadales bacterium PRO7]